MRSVVIRTQHTIEKPARPVARLPEKCGLKLRALPISRDTNAPAIREHEASHVPGLCRGMSAARRLRAPIDVATGITAEVLDGGHALAEVSFRGRLQPMPFPQCDRDRGSAVDREILAYIGGRSMNEHRVPESTVGARHAVRDRIEFQRRVLQHLATQ